jgi:hypothetical protein
MVPLQSVLGASSLLGVLVSVLIAVTVIAAGVYIGALRALDVYYGADQDSVFLSEDSGPD